MLMRMPPGVVVGVGVWGVAIRVYCWRVVCDNTLYQNDESQVQMTGPGVTTTCSSPTRSMAPDWSRR